jgi:hypothetical protein
MVKAAAKSDRSRNDDGANNQGTHGSVPQGFPSKDYRDIWYENGGIYATARVVCLESAASRAGVDSIGVRSAHLIRPVADNGPQNVPMRSEPDRVSCNRLSAWRHQRTLRLSFISAALAPG